MLQVTYSSDTCLYLLSLQVASLGHSSNLWGKYLRTLPRPTRCLDLSGLVLQTPGNSPFFSCSGSAHQPLPCTFLIPTLVGITLQQLQHQASGIGGNTQHAIVAVTGIRSRCFNASWKNLLLHWLPTASTALFSLGLLAPAP